MSIHFCVLDVLAKVLDVTVIHGDESVMYPIKGFCDNNSYSLWAALVAYALDKYPEKYVERIEFVSPYTYRVKLADI